MLQPDKAFRLQRMLQHNPNPPTQSVSQTYRIRFHASLQTRVPPSLREDAGLYFILLTLFFFCNLIPLTLFQ